MSEIQEEKEISEPITSDVKELRKQEWKRAVEAELQPLIIEAARLRGIITSAKTQTKRNFYQKKFNKIHATVLQYVDLIQKLEATMHLEDTVDDTITTNVE